MSLSISRRIKSTGRSVYPAKFIPVFLVCLNRSRILSSQFSENHRRWKGPLEVVWCKLLASFPTVDQLSCGFILLSLENLQDGHSSSLHLIQCYTMLPVKKLLPMSYLNIPIYCLWPLLPAYWAGKESCHEHAPWWMNFPYSVVCGLSIENLCPRSGGVLCWTETQVATSKIGGLSFIKNGGKVWRS